MVNKKVMLYAIEAIIVILLMGFTNNIYVLGISLLGAVLICIGLIKSCFIKSKTPVVKEEPQEEKDFDINNPDKTE